MTIALPMAATGTAQRPGCAFASSALRPQSHAEVPARPVFERFIDLMHRRHQVRAAFESCVQREGFIDHAGFRSRAAAMTSLAIEPGPGGAQVVLLHSVFEGDIGMVHLSVPGDGNSPPKARVEIFRVAEGRIVEHWSTAA
jgi:predicted SnoaL-like aldol condensation-catalyzing enzyme